MAFSEDLRKAVRRRADMRCCICRAVGVEIHHVIHQAEGGPDTEDNAAPLCPSCHELYGANPQKRKFVREARDFWYEVCDRRSSADAKVDQVLQAVALSATRDDLNSLRGVMLKDIEALIKPEQSRPPVRTLGEIIAHLYEFTSVSSKNGLEQADWLFKILWSDAVTDEEFEQLRRQLVDRFGSETARRVCHYVLQDHPYDILADGFTRPELQQLVSSMFVTMILLLCHVDLIGREEGLELGIDPSGDIRAWAAEHAPQPAGRSTDRQAAT